MGCDPLNLTTSNAKCIARSPSACLSGLRENNQNIGSERSEKQEEPGRSTSKSNLAVTYSHLGDVDMAFNERKTESELVEHDDKPPK